MSAFRSCLTKVTAGIAALSMFFAANALLIGGAAAAEPANCGQNPSVAFSFDDAPTGDTVIMTGAERTDKIITALRKAGIDEAAFFAVTSRADDEGLARLKRYGEAGHVIANHSHSHANLHRVDAAAFLEDVDAAHETLHALPGFKPWFRFPFLNEGQTELQRDQIRTGLDERNYRSGYVTIDNYDFHLNNRLRDAFKRNIELDMDEVSALYVETILGAAAHYDKLSCTWLGRTPSHVLLLHENDIAALFLPALISAFGDKGWRIISPSEAYLDAIADEKPMTLALGQGQVAALAHLAGAPLSDLRHPSEDTEVLDAAFDRIIEASQK